MANWLEKAIGKKDTAPAAVPFERVCQCGVSHSGLRAERAKRLICAECGEPHFILPINRYPISERRYFQPVIEEVETPPEVPPENKPAEVIRHPVRKKKKPKLEPAPVQPPPAEQPRRISPFAIVLGAFLSIGVAMSFWFVQSRERERAEAVLREATEQGEAHLANGDFASAYTELKKAMTAIDVIGVQGKQAQFVRRLYLEADAGAHLLAGSPIEVVEDAERTLGDSGAEAWRERFRVAYAGRWVLIHLPLIGGDESALRLPIDVNGVPIVFDGIGRQIAEARKASLLDVLVAGQLAGCRKTSDGIPEWVISFDEETAFLWSSETTFLHLGLIPDDEEIAGQMRSLVNRQAKLSNAESSGGEVADVVQ